MDIAPPLEADFPTDDDLECVAHPLSYAVRRGVGPDVIAILLDAGAATNCTYEYTKHEVDGTETVVTTSPLCLAVQLDFNNTERTVGVIKLLLAAGGQVGAVDSLGCSALYVLCRMNSPVPPAPPACQREDADGIVEMM